MKLVFAPDSFKGSLSALRAAQLLDQAAKKCLGEVETVLVPVADGGEGTVEALYTALGGEMRHAQVTGPLGQPVDAAYALLPDQTAVIEMAQASGLPLVPVDKRNPLLTSSRGTGELILQALDAGAKSLLIGLGGSATNDGGTGMLRALGVKLLDKQGRDVPEGGGALEQIEQVCMDGLDPRVREISIRVMCDVTNPLLGEKGATYVYGPQKGADAEKLALLEAGMAHYAEVVKNTLNRDIASFPGAGAAGGLGAALGGLLGAQLVKGIDAVLETTHFEGLLGGADLCVTGEGCFDRQSVDFGKVVSGIASACKRQNVPVVVMAGSIRGGAQALYDLCPDSTLMTTVPGVVSLQDAMERAEEFFLDAAERIFRLYRLGLNKRA